MKRVEQTLNPFSQRIFVDNESEKRIDYCSHANLSSFESLTLTKNDEVIISTLMDILRAREERVAYQKHLLDKYQASLISFKLNIPGGVKDSDLYRKIFREGMEYLVSLFAENQIPILFRKDCYRSTGPESFLISPKLPRLLKELVVQIENEHPLGRIFDFDVLDQIGQQIGRESLGFDSRQCFLCDNHAFECSRNRTHPLEEIIAHITQLAEDFFAR